MHPARFAIGMVAHVAIFGAMLYALVGLYSFVVILRVIIEMVESFSRHFDPPHWFMVAGEAIFVVTDPPVKALRRMIPPLRMSNGIGFDLSVIVLFVVLVVVQMVIRATLITPFV